MLQLSNGRRMLIPKEMLGELKEVPAEQAALWRLGRRDVCVVAAVG